jgi:hypothetical protein
VLLRGGGAYRRQDFVRRKLSHWGHVLEGDIWDPSPFSSFLLLLTLQEARHSLCHAIPPYHRPQATRPTKHELKPPKERAKEIFPLLKLAI